MAQGVAKDINETNTITGSWTSLLFQKINSIRDPTKGFINSLMILIPTKDFLDSFEFLKSL